MSNKPLTKKQQEAVDKMLNDVKAGTMTSQEAKQKLGDLGIAEQMIKDLEAESPKVYVETIKIISKVAGSIGVPVTILNADYMSGGGNGNGVCFFGVPSKYIPEVKKLLSEYAKERRAEKKKQEKKDRKTNTDES